MSRRTPSLLNSYLKYADTMESPTAFHFWSLCSVIASCLGRHTYMDRGRYTLYPNMYVVLVAESAWCRKSTALNSAYRLLEGSEIEMVKEKMTMPYLYKHLGVQAQAGTNAELCVVASELSTLLGMDAHSSGLVATLTNIYDCPPVAEYRTKGSGVEIIPNPCLNIMGATTLDWMSNAMPGETVEGGFTSRVIFVVQNKAKRRVAWPGESQDDRTLLEDIGHDLQEVMELKGEFVPTPGARDLFQQWYNSAVEPEDSRLRGYFGRKGDHILKISMILSAAENSSMSVTSKHVMEAIDRLEETEELMQHAFRGVAYSKTSQHADRVLLEIEKFGEGGVKHSKILKKMCSRLSAAEMKDVIDTLSEAELISVERVGKSKHYTAMVKKPRRDR